jgi:hypothetical protein
MVKINCWEFMKCGKERGGTKAEESGDCPPSTLKNADGLNDGMNAGRMCWAVASNLCGGTGVGMFVPKAVTCMNCPFYKLVAGEQGKDVLVFIL